MVIKERQDRAKNSMIMALGPLFHGLQGFRVHGKAE